MYCTISCGILLACLVAVISTSEKETNKFLDDCSDQLKERQTKCLSQKISYFLWMRKHQSEENAFFCLLKRFKSKNIKNASKRDTLILLHLILKKKKANKCSKLALKLAQTISKGNLDFSKQWTFLGPFQIGKPEIDGTPISKYAVENRWNSKFTLFSELVPDGFVKWADITADNDGSLKLSPKLNWNDLIMSLQSMAVTEWQGIAVNDFSTTSDNLMLAIQCIGVNYFYVDGTLVNGEIYHRNEFW